MTIPTNEPDSLRAGDTWRWRREDLSTDYPAPTWTLTYRFKNATSGFEITASASGTYFAVTNTATATADYAAGVYQWIARVSDGTSTFTVDKGTLTVLPDFADEDSALDTRSHARKCLDSIEAVLENRATKDQQEYAINGRQLTRMKEAELRAFRDYYRAEVRSEDAAERAANGMPDNRRAYVRFGRNV